MWDRLKQLISDSLGKRPPRRRNTTPCFRGRFEPLETRHMLSAAIGMGTVDFEAAAVMVVTIWQYPAPLQPPTAFHATYTLDNATWESTLDYDYFADLGREHGAELKPDPNVPLGLRGGQEGGSGEALNTVQFPQSLYTGPVGTNGSSQPVKLVSQAAGSAGQGDSTNYRNPIRGASDVVDQDANNLSKLSAPYAVVTSSTLSSVTSLETREAAFDKLSHNALLLAVNLSSRTSSILDDDLDADLNSLEKPADGNPAEWSLVDQTVVDSLDALHRQRAAIDAVLTDLQEITLHSTTPKRDEVSGDHETQPAVAYQADRSRVESQSPMPALSKAKRKEGWCCSYPPVTRIAAHMTWQRIISKPLKNLW